MVYEGQAHETWRTIRAAGLDTGNVFGDGGAERRLAAVSDDLSGNASSARRRRHHNHTPLPASFAATPPVTFSVLPWRPPRPVGADEPAARRQRRRRPRRGVVHDRDARPSAQRRRDGQLTVLADTAFCCEAILATAAKFDVRFWITARQDKRGRRSPRSTSTPDSRSRTG
jgi:hypothetical protein